MNDAKARLFGYGSKDFSAEPKPRVKIFLRLAIGDREVMYRELGRTTKAGDALSWLTSHENPLAQSVFDSAMAFFAELASNERGRLERQPRALSLIAKAGDRELIVSANIYIGETLMMAGLWETGFRTKRELARTVWQEYLSALSSTMSHFIYEHSHRLVHPDKMLALFRYPASELDEQTRRPFTEEIDHKRFRCWIVWNPGIEQRESSREGSHGSNKVELIATFNDSCERRFVFSQGADWAQTLPTGVVKKLMLTTLEKDIRGKILITWEGVAGEDICQVSFVLDTEVFRPTGKQKQAAEEFMRLTSSDPAKEGLWTALPLFLSQDKLNQTIGELLDSLAMYYRVLTWERAPHSTWVRYRGGLYLCSRGSRGTPMNDANL